MFTIPYGAGFVSKFIPGSTEPQPYSTLGLWCKKLLNYLLKCIAHIEGGGYVTESLAFLYTGAKSNPRDRVLGEVEKDSFIALPGKGGHNGLLFSKTMCPNPGGFEEGFYKNGSRWGL